MAEMSEDDITQYMRMIGELVDSVMVPDATFCIVVFGPGGKGHYVANGRREDVIRALREFTDSLEDRTKEDVEKN